MNSTTQTGLILADWMTALLLATTLVGCAQAEGRGTMEAGSEPPSLDGSASGTFAKGDGSFVVKDGFAVPGEGMFGGEIIEVHLVPMMLDRTALAAAIDPVFELNAQVAASHALGWAVLEMDPLTGRWKGSRYGLPDGNGCGFCSTESEILLALENGRLSGALVTNLRDEVDVDGLAVNLAIDLGIHRVSGLSDLSADGGKPGNALVACWEAARTENLAEIGKLCFAAEDEQMKRLEHVREDARMMMAFYGRSQLRAESLEIIGGTIKNDQAELRVTTIHEDEKHHGSVFMRKTEAGWRFNHHRMAPVWE